MNATRTEVARILSKPFMWSASTVITIVAIFALLFLLGNYGYLGNFLITLLRFAILLALPLIMFSFAGWYFYVKFVRNKAKPDSADSNDWLTKTMFLLLVFLAIGVLVTVSVWPDTGFNEFFKGIFGTGDTAPDIINLVSVVITLWAGGATSLILLQQAVGEINENHREHRFNVAIDNAENRLMTAITNMELRQISDREALDELQRWKTQDTVESVYIFGAFSAIPGFWKDKIISQQVSSVISEIVVCRIKVEIIGPTEESLLELTKYVHDNMSSDSAAHYWSKVFKTGNNTENWGSTLIQYYKATISDIQNAGVAVDLVPHPWKASPITFSLALNHNKVPTSAIFFGAPLGNTQLDGDVLVNIFAEPKIYISKNREVMSLLTHFWSLLKVSTRIEETPIIKYEGATEGRILVEGAS